MNFFQEHWPVIMIIALVILCLIVLFWPPDECEEKDKRVAVADLKPPAPTPHDRVTCSHCKHLVERQYMQFIHDVHGNDLIYCPEHRKPYDSQHLIFTDHVACGADKCARDHYFHFGGRRHFRIAYFVNVPASQREVSAAGKPLRK